MASGNPPMINGNDCDLDTSILDSELHTASNFISPFLELLIRLSGIWSDGK